MTAILAFLLIPWVFYSLLIIGIIIITWAHEFNDEGENHLGWAHTIFIVLMCLLVYKFNEYIPQIKANPWIAVKYFGSYIFIGIIWAFIKWYSYLKSITSNYEEIKEKLLEKIQSSKGFEKLDGIGKFKLLQEELYDYFKIGRYGHIGFRVEKLYGDNKYKVQIPIANDNKSLIISWISHWPISLVWTIINDPVKKLLNYIFSHIKGLFQKMSNRIFKDVIQDFK